MTCQPVRCRAIVRGLPPLALALAWLACTFAAGVLSPPLHAQEKVPTIPFDEAKVYIELNASAEDAGIQVFLDSGDTWKWLKGYDSRGRKILDVTAQGSVGVLGVSEFFFESAEPGFDELPYEEFLELFPEGWYRFQGETVEGVRLSSRVRLTHAVPEGPEIVAPSEGAIEDPADTEISWRPVADPPRSRIVAYQVIVEGGEPQRQFQATVDPSTTALEVPAHFLEPGTDYVFEILAIEAGGNQTITEGSFSTE